MRWSRELNPKRRSKAGMVRPCTIDGKGHNTKRGDDDGSTQRQGFWKRQGECECQGAPQSRPKQDMLFFQRNPPSGSGETRGSEDRR